MIALWDLLGKSFLLGFPLVLFLFYAVFTVSVPFGQDVELDCIGS